MHERVILVWPDDALVGTAEKLWAHCHGHLHRALSFVWRVDGALLLQRRAATKYHSAAFSDVREEIARAPGRFTAWFRPALAALTGAAHHSDHTRCDCATRRADHSTEVRS